MITLNDKDTARFLAKVATNDDPGQCWYWQAGKHGDGYGGLLYSGESQRAHRVAYTLAHGQIPPGLDVLHSCDNPTCCNPSHLTAGTRAQNMADKVARMRNRTRYLTDAQVGDLKRLWHTGEFSRSDLAEKFEVSAAQIQNITQGKAHTKVPCAACADGSCPKVVRRHGGHTRRSTPSESIINDINALDVPRVAQPQ